MPHVAPPIVPRSRIPVAAMPWSCSITHPMTPMATPMAASAMNRNHPLLQRPTPWGSRSLTMSCVVAISHSGQGSFDLAGLAGGRGAAHIDDAGVCAQLLEQLEALLVAKKRRDRAVLVFDVPELERTNGTGVDAGRQHALLDSVDTERAFLDDPFEMGASRGE